MLRRSLVATTTLILGIPAVAAAQDVAAVCEAVGRLEVGQWATYDAHPATEASSGVESMRLALVDGESTPEGEMVWYEFKAETDEGPIIIQALVPAFPFQPQDIQEVIMKAGDQPAMKMPARMLAMVRQQMSNNPMLDFTRQCEQAEVVGAEEVTVPAGSFETTHVTGLNGGEAWISDDVAIGIVKAISSDGSTLLLTGSGSGAESSITETPQEISF